MTKLKPREIFLVFLILASAYGYFFSQQDANTNSRLALVKAIVEEKRLEIDSYHDTVLDTADKSFYNGHYYSDKAIGTSLLGVPVYYLLLRISILADYPLTLKIKTFKQLITLFAISLPCAFLAAFLYQFVKDVSRSNWFSLLAALAIGLGTPLFFYSATYYSHSLVGFLLFLVFYLWFRIRQNGKISLKIVALSGFLLGYAMITEYTPGVIIPILGIYILWVIFQQKRLSDKKIYFALVASALPPLLTMFIYNYSIFESPLSIGYLHEAEDHVSKVLQTNMGFGFPDLGVLFYMTFHTTMGIFWQSPVLLLAFPGWIVMWKNKEYCPEAITSFSIIFIYFVILSGYYWWWGGLVFTPRFIIASLPFFVVPLTFVYSNKYGRVLLLILGIISIAQIFIVTSTTSAGLDNILVNITPDHFYAMFENSIIYSVYWPNFFSQQLVPNLGALVLHLQGFTSLLPLFLIQAILLISFTLTARKP